MGDMRCSNKCFFCWALFDQSIFICMQIIFVSNFYAEHCIYACQGKYGDQGMALYASLLAGVTFLASNNFSQIFLLNLKLNIFLDSGGLVKIL